MKIDLYEPYHIIANESDEVRREFWKRALEIIEGIKTELWHKQVLALGKEKWIKGRLEGCENFLSEKELIEKRERLNTLFAEIEKEQNEQPT